MLCSRATVPANVLMLVVFWLLGLTNALEVASTADLSAAADTANAWDDVSAQPLFRRAANIRGDRGLGSKSNAVSPNSTSTAKSSKSRKSKSKSGSGSSGSGSTPVDPIDPIVEPPIDPIAPIGRESCTCGDDGYTVEVGRNSKSNAIDLSALTYSILDKPSNIDFASLDSSQGVYTYTPRRGYRGEDVFVYQIVDANTGFTKSATVTVVVGNRAPVALSAEYETGAGDTIEFTLQATDADVTNNIQEESDLTYTITTMMDGLNGSGNTYTFSSKTSGTYKIGFTVSDGLASDEGTITIIVTAAPPEAFDATYTTNEEESIEITLGAKSGGTDVPVTSPEGGCGDFLYVVDGSSVKNGEVSKTDHSCIYSYTPNPGFSGQGSFMFYVLENGVESNVATITINVNAIPVASDVSATTDQNTPVDISVSATDSDLGGALTFSIEKKPSNGLVAESNTCDSGPVDVMPGDGTTAPGIPGDITGTIREGIVPGNRALQFTGIVGTFTACYKYTPNEGFAGTDTFTYVASDGTADSNEATVAITVRSPNNAPEAEDQSILALKGRNEAIYLRGSDIDDDDSLSFSITRAPLKGELFDDCGILQRATTARRCYVYKANENGKDSFQYQVSDRSGATDTGEISITIQESNTKPVAVSSNATIPSMETSVDITLMASDEDGDELTYSILVEPSAGSLSDIIGNKVTYTKDENTMATSDSFRFWAFDGLEYSNSVLVNIYFGGFTWARVGTCQDDRFCCKEFAEIVGESGNKENRRLDNSARELSDPTETCEIQRNNGGVRRRNLFSTEAIQRLVEKRPGEVNLDINFVEEENMLTVKQCNDLIEYLNTKSPMPKDALYQDKILDISAEDLLSTIGLETVQALLDFLYHSVGEKAPVREISLRRTVNNEKHGHFIDFHTDEEVSGYRQSTVIVPIGDEENDVIGGDPWYLGNKGPVKTKRVRGKAYAHSYDVLHAVGPIIGKRMSLLIHLDHSAADEVDLLHSNESRSHQKSLISGTGLR